MDDLTVDKILAHYGVKGMKWGVRKRKTSSDFDQTVPHRKKRAKELSNQELTDVNKRLNLERSYKQLNPSTVKRGEMAAKGIIGTVGTLAALYSLRNSPLAKAGADFISKYVWYAPSK